jgi:hypothetical protein
MKECSPAAFHVLVIMAERADEYGYGAWPSIRNMATSLACSERTVQRAIRELLAPRKDPETQEELDPLIRLGDQSQTEHMQYRPTVYDVLTPALRYIEKQGRHNMSPLPKSRGDIFVPVRGDN